MAQRRKMQLGDWYHAVPKFVIGVLIGEVIDGFARLFVLGAWGEIWILAGFVAALALVWIFYELLEKLVDRFIIGVKYAGRREPLGRRPLARLVSLPVGLGFGMILAQLGLGVAGLLSF